MFENLLGRQSSLFCFGVYQIFSCPLAFAKIGRTNSVYVRRMQEHQKTLYCHWLHPVLDLYYWLLVRLYGLAISFRNPQASWKQCVTSIKLTTYVVLWLDPTMFPPRQCILLSSSGPLTCTEFPLWSLLLMLALSLDLPKTV